MELFENHNKRGDVPALSSLVVSKMETMASLDAS